MLFRFWNQNVMNIWATLRGFCIFLSRSFQIYFVFAANPIPTSSSVVTCTPSEYRFASAPIPVRPTRMYGPLNQPAFNPIQQQHQQQMSFSFGMSPYQSPMDSPLTSPFTSPSPSPKSSPLPSPRLSPFPSPVESPMFRKKFGGDRLLGRRSSDQYASVYDWLRSLRLHKYSETFKDYTFDQVSVFHIFCLSLYFAYFWIWSTYFITVSYIIRLGNVNYYDHKSSSPSITLNHNLYQSL